MDAYIRKVLRISVAQICQTIGYNSFQSIPLELLVDSLQKFLQEFSRDLHQHVELFNRTEANLDDVALTLQSLNISTGDLMEYINHVQPVSCNIDVPELPAQKSSNLNFLKPGSKEVLTRPVHIYGHLPPTLHDTVEEEDKSNIILASPNTSQLNASNDLEDEMDRKISTEHLFHLNETNSTEKNQMQVDVVSKSAIPSSSTREISSVMMTSGGFISPAMEGKTPESVIPDIVEKYFGLDAPPSSPSPPPVNFQAQSNSQTTKSSLNTNPSYSPLSNDNPNHNFTPKTPKISQHSDKKKLKKKTLGNLPPNNVGIVPNVFTDKAQRKRFKMLQKSMVKNGSVGSMSNLKSKSHTILSQSSQEKLLKKQFKHKEKQLRKQTIQKHTESVVNITVPNIFRGSINKASMTNLQDISKSNLKKDITEKMSAQSEDIQPIQDTDVENSTLCKLSPFSNSNAIHQKDTPSGGGQDMETLQSLSPMAQYVAGGTHSLSMQSDEIKLNNEPDRSKLNIFKKISSSARKERGDAPQIQHPELKPLASGSNGGTSIFGDSQVISLPSGTTITPAPPSGSGRHVYAPPPPSSQKSGDFSSVLSVDDSITIPEGSAVLMQRGDLMIQKPKKRGRKPGSKNQPKILGLNTKKSKKLKKSSFFGHHSSTTIMEPLNLSHNSIDNLANIPLGIASTFPIDGGINLKMKKERKKSKMGKEPEFMHNHSKASASSMVPCSSRNMAPTKEEFGSINQKLMMMNTVLQPAPLMPSVCSSMSLPSKSSTARPISPSFSTSSLPNEVDTAMRPKKERKKQQKQIKDQQKQSLQSHHNNQVMKPTGSGESSSQYASSSQSFSSSGVLGMDGMPMFPFYPFPVRPGLIPSHNLFSQLPNVNNNGLFMPPLMGFPPLNHSIRPFLKDDTNTNSTPIPMAPEGNYSKVAPLVPDTMRLELSPGTSSTKSKTATFTPRDIGQALHNTTEPMSSLLSPGHVGVVRKKSDDHHSESISMSTVLKNSETIEVSSDDSETDNIRRHSTMTPTFVNRSAVPLTGIPSGLYRQSRNPIQPPPLAISNNHNPDINIINSDIDRSSSIERRNKEHKKMKKNIKQGKKQSQSSGHELFPVSTQAINMTLEFSKKSADSTANSSGGNLALDCESSPEKRKDHKKMKKLLKEIKIKKKKDKKDKNKNKEKNPDKIIKIEKSEREKRKEEKKDKDKLKKLKKDKKKSKEDKERNEVHTAVGGAAGKYTSPGGMGSGIEVSSVVPKITLKLGQSVQSPISSIKAGGKSSLYSNAEREQSPELARISPLVTRPPKQQKPGIDENGCSIGNMPSGPATVLNDSVIDIDSNSGGPSTFMLPASATILGGVGLSQSICPKTPGSTNLTCSTFHSSSGSSNLQHTPSSNKQSLSSSVISEANRPTSYVDTSAKDAEGNRVWICPACGKVDDGSPMIGCDGCDAWYHWVCVGILVAPDDNEDWYCRVCIAKKRGVHGGDRKRKRNKKKNSDF